MYINKKNIIKYLIQFIIVTITSYLISPCPLKIPFAITVGLISASTFAIVDTYYPVVVYK